MTIGQHRVLLDGTGQFDKPVEVPNSVGPLFFTVQAQAEEFANCRYIRRLFDKSTQHAKRVAIALTFKRS